LHWYSELDHSVIPSKGNLCDHGLGLSVAFVETYVPYEP